MRTGNSKPSWTGFFGETESEIFQEIIDGDFDCDGYVAIDQAADSGWWHIASHSDQASYGYGSRSEAEEYAEFLDVGVGPTAVHHIRPISFREAFEMREYLVEGDLGFALDESLVVLREQRAQAA